MKKNRKSLKFDNGKPALAYIPKEAMYAMGEALNFGAQKYGKFNYANSGLEYTRLASAALRHIYQFLSGEDRDAESKALHIGCAMANLAMLCYNYENLKQNDDRKVDKLKKSVKMNYKATMPKRSKKPKKQKE